MMANNLKNFPLGFFIAIIGALICIAGLLQLLGPALQIRVFGLTITVLGCSIQVYLAARLIYHQQVEFYLATLKKHSELSGD